MVIKLYPIHGGAQSVGLQATYKCVVLPGFLY
jgi:hypothetical protein